jgi:chromosome segregation ATPase
MSNANIENTVQFQGQQIDHLKSTLERMEDSVRANAESSKRLTEVVIDMAKTQERLSIQQDLLTSLAVDSKANSARLNKVENTLALIDRDVTGIPSMWNKISKIKEEQIKNSVITALVTTIGVSIIVGIVGVVISRVL